MTVEWVVIAFEASKHLLTLPFHSSEVGSPDTVVSIAGPDEISIVTEYVWISLTRILLLGKGI